MAERFAHVASIRKNRVTPQASGPQPMPATAQPASHLATTIPGTPARGAAADIANAPTKVSRHERSDAWLWVVVVAGLAAIGLALKVLS